MEGIKAAGDHEKKLYKSSKNKRIGGIYKVIAECFRVDQTMVCVRLVLFGNMGGSGILFYIIIEIVMLSDQY